MKNFVFAVMALALALLVSCKQEMITTPSASGRPYELMVVIDRSTWEEPVGQALRKMLTSEIPGLPQSEPMFRLSRVSESEFDATCRMFRNILFIDINPEVYSRVSLKYATDEFAKGQVIVHLQVPSKRALLEYIQSEPKNIINLICQQELLRTAETLQKEYNATTSKLVDSLFGCKVKLPTELERAKNCPDFTWVSTRSYDKNFVIYTYPYEGPQTFTKEYVLAKRDSFMKANIPGTEPGSYMGTDTLYTESYPINVQNAYCMETRGLWRMQGEFLGGPFVSHSRVDTVNNRVIVAEGFIMELKNKNSVLMRRMEGCLYTLSLPAK